jgi:putative peptidoglycan lipid II flippase
MAVLAPGFGGSEREETLGLTRVLLLMAASVGGARIMAIVLQAEKKFLVAGSSEAVFQITSTVYMVAFCSTGIQAVVWGQVVGGFAQLLTVCAGLYSRRRHVRFSLDFRSAPVRKMVRLTLPVYLGESGAKANMLVTRAFPSMLPAGAVSSLQYAFALSETLPTLLINALVGALFPFLAQQFAQKDDRGARGSLGRAMIITSLVFMPLTIGVALLAQPLVVILFQRGSFDRHSTTITASSLQVLAPGIVALAMNALLAAAFHARQNTAVPMKAGLARVACNIVLCSVFVPSLGLLGVALAATVSLYFKMLLLFFFLRDIFSPGEISHLIRTLGRVAIAVACMGAVVQVAARSFFSEAAVKGWKGAVIEVVALALLGAVCYVAALAGFCREEFDLNLQLLCAELGLHRPASAHGIEAHRDREGRFGSPSIVPVLHPLESAFSLVPGRAASRRLEIWPQSIEGLPLRRPRTKAPPGGLVPTRVVGARSWPAALRLGPELVAAPALAA